MTFEDRVIFSDRDMGGSTDIAAGTRKVHISFARPYAEIPVITITPVDHDTLAYVSGLSRYGFDIETTSTATYTLKFNWMAVLVRGGIGGYTDQTNIEDSSIAIVSSTGA